MSTLKVNTIQSNTTSELDINSPLGTIPSLDVIGSATIGGNLNAVGVITATSIVATTGTFSGNVSIGGTLTYEDVTNIDSVGIITARSGVRVNSGGLVVTSGVSTFTNLVVSAGSTSAPSISPTGDSNTGIFFPSPDTVAIGEGGIEALRVDSNGNIGVNTISTNPLGNGGTFKNLTVFTPGGYAAFGGISDLTASGSTIAAFNAGTLGASSAKNAASINVELDGTSTTNATGRIVFYTAASGSVTEKARITSTGNVQIANGNLVFSTAGTGIDFSAAGNAGGMSSELLDDYEEGTWTPTLTNFSIGSPSYQYQEGHYTKIGRYVIAQGIMGITNSNTLGSGTIQINLPFTAGSTTYGQCGPVADGSGFTSFNQFGTMVGNSASVGQFVTIGTSATGISYNQPSAAWYVRFCFMYHTV